MSSARRLEDRVDPEASDQMTLPRSHDRLEASHRGDGPSAVLLVDDHRENLAALEAVLEPLGQRLISVESGEDALRVLLHEDVAAILLDVRMPGLDGVETARIVRSRPATRHIPIIFLTAMVSDAEQIEQAYATGAVDYVIKPFEPAILRAKVMAFVSLASERAERLRQSQARASAEAAARAVRTLQSLSDVALAHLDLEPLASELLDRACALFGADSAALLLSDDETHELRPFAHCGEHLQIPRDGLIGSTSGAISSLMRGRRTAMLSVGEPAWEELEQASSPAGLHSLAGVVAVPLTAEEEGVGLLLLAARDENAFDAAGLELLGLAADRMAIAIDHARRFEHERQQVVVLQSSLLPDSLPEHPRLQLAARYVPGEAGAQIGGDWYDALQLDQSRLAVMIGDVVGHGTAAAARMGELRHALRAYAAEGHSPADALRKLDRLVAGILGEKMVATVLLLIADTSEGSVTVARAGHPPPLVRGVDGAIRVLDSEGTLPVGVMRETIPVEVTYSLAEGETLLLYTDGLVERRTEPIDVGIERLRRAFGEAQPDPEAACDHVMTRLLTDRPGRDDVAVLAMRRLPTARGSLRLTLPAVSGSVTVARHRVRDWLQANVPELDGEVGSDLEVAVSEACTNVVRHAYGPADASFLLTAMREADAVTLAVSDHGSWRPPRGEHGGRGLKLIRAVCDAVQIDKRADGTTVTMRRLMKAPPTSTAAESA